MTNYNLTIFFPELNGEKNVERHRNIIVKYTRAMYSVEEFNTILKNRIKILFPSIHIKGVKVVYTYNNSNYKIIL